MAMFIATQLIGLYVVNFYLAPSAALPYGFDEQARVEKTTSFYTQFLISLIISFIIAIILVFILMRINAVWFIRGWFFVVIALALGITLNVITVKLGLAAASFFALAIGVLLAYIKVFKRNILVHNITELLIYPGIAAIFVAMLNLWATIAILIIISIYDIWAVWHSGVMQKMAKYQINSVGVFGGFFIPYASKKIKEKIAMLKLKYKDHKIPEKTIKKHKIKISLAILGGGDVIFPIIAAGVFFKTYNSLIASLCVTLFASLALLYLFVFAKKKKFYPAMPYLTAGIFLGMVLGRLLVS